MRRRWFAAWPGLAYSGNSIGIRSWIRQTKRARLRVFSRAISHALFEMVVRDQQIDGAGGPSRNMPNSRRSLPASSARRAWRAIRRTRRSCCARIERPAPGRADFADKIFGDPARQQRQPAVRRDAPRKRPAARSRSGARHRQARPGRCRSAFRGRRATAGATGPERSLRRLPDQRRPFRSDAARPPRDSAGLLHRVLHDDPGNDRAGQRIQQCKEFLQLVQVGVRDVDDVLVLDREALGEKE